MPSTLIGAIYRPPGLKMNYLKRVTTEMKKVIKDTQPSHILIGGDFNFPDADWENNKAPPRTPHRKQVNHLLSTIEDLSLHQVVHIPTRRENTLDLLFTDAPDLVNNVSTAPGLSDHDTIIFQHQLKSTLNKKEPRNVPLYNKAHWDDIHQHVTSFTTEYLNANASQRRSLETNWKRIQDIVFHCCSRLIPHKKIGSRFNLPYITGDIKSEKAAKKHGRQRDWNMYRQLKCEIQHDLNVAYRKYINDMLNIEEDLDGFKAELH